MTEEQRVPLTRTQRAWIAGVYHNLNTATPQCPVSISNIDTLMDEHKVPVYRDQLSHDQGWVLDPPFDGEKE